jgi:outer membrane protein assembly factor BamB
MQFRLNLILTLFLCAFAALREPLLRAAEPWSTYRGNLQRTGNTDGVAGPSTPKVLWVHRSQDHFIAAPVPAVDRVYVSGLGAFNVSTFAALSVDPKAAQRVSWSKTTPYLKLPTVSSPAVSDGKLVFGDGMHQTDGAILHCLRADKGLPLWQLPVPGKLVHLEGSPTILDGRVYLGGGAAGVMCIDLNRVTLDGKEMDLAAIQKLLETRWKELLAKYEEEKKKDPDFAVPPNEDQLPKPAPVQLWQQGKDKWHVDAPVAVTGDSVLVASAYLDDEKVGERALFSLSAKTGEIRWKAPVQSNPWGGPSVQGDTVIVAGSSIRYDPKLTKGAKGEVVALDLGSGKEKWRKEVPGGVVSCVALSDGLAIATATDGKVRAFNIADGDRRWIYDAKTALFAPVAVAAGTVYAGDLGGVLHAISLSDGKPKWTLNLGTDAAVKAPGMIYGGPIVHAGKLYFATCNLEGPFARKPTVLVCIGDK